VEPPAHANHARHRTLFVGAALWVVTRPVSVLVPAGSPPAGYTFADISSVPGLSFVCGAPATNLGLHPSWNNEDAQLGSEGFEGVANGNYAALSCGRAVHGALMRAGIALLLALAAAALAYRIWRGSPDELARETIRREVRAHQRLL